MTTPINSLNSGNELNTLTEFSNQNARWPVHTEGLDRDKDALVFSTYDVFGSVTDSRSVVTKYQLSNEYGPGKINGRPEEHPLYNKVYVSINFTDLNDGTSFTVNDVDTHIWYDTGSYSWMLYTPVLKLQLTYGHKYCGTLIQKYHTNSYWEPSSLPDPYMLPIVVSEFEATDYMVEKTLMHEGFEVGPDSAGVYCYKWYKSYAWYTYKAQVFNEDGNPITNSNKDDIIVTRGPLVDYSHVF